MHYKLQVAQLQCEVKKCHVWWHNRAPGVCEGSPYKRPDAFEFAQHERDTMLDKSATQAAYKFEHALETNLTKISQSEPRPPRTDERRDSCLPKVAAQSYRLR
jgi:hypothetical protein